MQQGGQAKITYVQHEDGREGVYRELKSPVSQVDRARFVREINVLSERVHHRAIVSLFDWSTDTETLWYISELGDEFKKWWSRAKTASGGDPASIVSKALSVLTELISAVSLCHDNGIVHRDIKPKNIVIKRGVLEPWPILIDFGLVHAEDEARLTSADDAVGNARFSPDIMRTRLAEVPPWLDVFDLAQLLIWMLGEQAPKDHWNARYIGSTQSIVTLFRKIYTYLYVRSLRLALRRRHLLLMAESVPLYWRIYSRAIRDWMPERLV